jgi:hypothetical protein
MGFFTQLTINNAGVDDNFPTAESATDRNQILVFEVVPQWGI